MSNRENEIILNCTMPESTARESVVRIIKNSIVNNADDYLKWNWKSFRYNMHKTGKNSLKIVVSVKYLTTKDQEAMVNQKTIDVLSQILTTDAKDYEVIESIHRYMVDNVCFDDTLSKRSAYNAFFDKKAVCQGYSLMAYKLLSSAGIPIHIISGTLNDDPHGWNLVEINGNWYHLDVTNDDFSKSKKFYLVTDSVMRKNGYKWDEASYPASN
jgi:transglutaminase/protease-like cytokinesis protein 3